MQTNNYSPYNTPRTNGLAVVALIMGILSLLLMCCGGGFVFGALGIMFAALSRGAGKMNTQAKVGLGLSIAGLVVSIFLYIVLIFFSIVSYVEQETVTTYEYNYSVDDWYNYFNDSLRDFENGL